MKKMVSRDHINWTASQLIENIDSAVKKLEEAQAIIAKPYGGSLDSIQDPAWSTVLDALMVLHHVKNDLGFPRDLSQRFSRVDLRLWSFGS
jgi:hypothetical protein